MTVSLEAMAMSHAYYFGTFKPTSPPIIRVTSPDPTNSIEVSNQENSAVNFSWSKMSITLSSKSLNSCRYETSSEGRLRMLQEPISRPTNVTHNVEDRHPLRVLKFSDKIVSSLIRVPSQKMDIPEIIDAPESIERSESLPVLGYNHLRDSNDQISRRAGMLNRIVSESSKVRMEKFKKIVSYVESTGWSQSGVILSDESSSDQCTVTVPLNEANELINSALVVQDPCEFFDKIKGVTFSTANDNDKNIVADTEIKMGYKNYPPLIDDLINIAKNENPSIKSMYFPPNPGDPLLTSDRRTITGDSKTSRIFSRNRSDLAALSRIENELVPLQNEFSQLTRKVRALNLIGIPYNFCAGPWTGSTEMSEPMSRDTSGYFLHRAKVFCHKDSPQKTLKIHDSQLAVLSTADNSAVVGTVAAGCSWDGHENAHTNYQQSRNLLRISAQPFRASCKSSLQVGNNEVRFFHEKPITYHLPYGFPIGHNDYPEKPMCFGNIGGESQQDHLTLYHQSQRRSLLPIDDHFQNQFSEFLNNSRHKIQLHAPSTQSCTIISNDIDESRRCIEPSKNNFYSIDGTIGMPRTTARNFDEGPESSCVSRKRSLTSRPTSPPSSSMKGTSSKKSEYLIQPDNYAHIVKQRHCIKEKMVSQKMSHHDGVQHHNERGSSRKSDRITPCSGESSITETHELEPPHKIIPNKDNFLLTERRNSQNIKDCSSTGRVILHPVGEMISSLDNPESLNMETTTPLISSSRVLKPSRTSVEISELDNSELAEKQQIKFIDPHEPENPRTAQQFEKDTRDRRAYEKRLRLPASEKKITIIPVMYTAGIPETLNNYESAIIPCKKITKKSSRQGRLMDKRDNKLIDRPETSSKRTRPILSTDGMEALPSCTSSLSHFTDGNDSFFGHEKPWLGQWRTASRFSASYSSSNILTSASRTLNTERTLKTVASKWAMTHSPTIANLSSETFSSGNISPITVKMPHSNNSEFCRTTNYEPTSSTRGRSNDQVIGISTSPDDFLDDA